MGKPVIHAVDHSPGGADPLKSWGADADDVLTSDGTGGVAWSPVATVGGGTGIHFGDNVGPNPGGWLNIQTHDSDGSAGDWGMNLDIVDGNGQIRVENGYLNIQTNVVGSYLNLFGSDFTRVQLSSSLPTYTPANKFVVTDFSLNSFFEVRGDGSIHGKASVGSITWDL